MATRKTTTSDDPANESGTGAPVYSTSTLPAEDPRTDPAPVEVQEDETDEQREARQAYEADSLASNQSGFAQRVDPPVTEIAPVVPAALNAATLDGMPVPFDRSTEMVIDEHSGAIVSVPVDRDDRSSDDEDEKSKDGDKA